MVSNKHCLLYFFAPPLVEWGKGIKRCPYPYACVCVCVRPSVVVGMKCAQLLLQFYADLFVTLQMFLSWSEDVHVV